MVASVRRRKSAPALKTVAGAKNGMLPAFVEPCLARLADAPPSGDQWVHEIKFDGYRLQARIDGGKVQLLTRRGLDWTHRFGALVQALAALDLRSALIDGEAVVEGDTGVTSFVRLVEDLKAGHSQRMVYFAFDLLYFGGVNVTSATLLQRKMLLKDILKRTPKAGPIRYSEHIAGDGAAMLREACKLGLEGIISKHTEKPYRAGRRDDWLKSKCRQGDEFVIAGYLDSVPDPQSVGALVLGFFERGRLVYAGRVGTGFSRRAATELWQQLQPLRTKVPPLSKPLTALQRRGVVWVKPDLIAEIEYRGWTSDELLRQAAFKALRQDKAARDIRRPRAKPIRRP